MAIQSALKANAAMITQKNAPELNHAILRFFNLLFIVIRFYYTIPFLKQALSRRMLGYELV